MKLKPILSLAGLLILILFTRFWNITNLPPSLFSDEVDAGYQAMVFNQNKTDYFNNKFPVHFRSFSDYRTSAYIYSITLFQRITGNNEISVRLPSAVFSLICIVLFYLITRSFSAAFLLTISPWSIHYGRTGFEVSGMLMVLLLGFYLFKIYLNQKHWYLLVLSVLSFSASVYFYSTAKLFLPIILVLIFIIYFKDVVKITKTHILVSIIFSLIFLTPMLIDTVKGHSGFRFSYISIFTQPHREQITDTLRYEDVFSDNIGKVGVKTPFLSYIFHSKYQLVLQKFITNYFSSFSTNFLFLTGDSNARHGFGNFGLLYFLDFFFVPIGIYIYLKKKNKLGTFFFYLLLLAPIPFALTRDSISPHSTRLILMLPSLICFSALALKRFPLFIPVYLLLFFTFWHYYQFHYPQESARVWHTGMKETVLATNNYSQSPLIFSNSYEPFLPFFLFYHPYSLPKDTSIADHLKETNNSSFSGQVLDQNYYFGQINWDNLSQLPANSIYIIPKSEYTSRSLTSFSTLQLITKKYVNQEEFYLLRSPPLIPQ